MFGARIFVKSSLVPSLFIAKNQIKYISTSKIVNKMILSEVTKKLEEFAPLCFGEKWDNIGLLIEPSGRNNIKKILLTNDLTEDVMSEALNEHVNLIISYHPPIFEGLKRITSAQWKQRIVIQCLENKIALYSPHTSWDSVANGITDWLAASVPIKISYPAIPSLINPAFGGGRICEVRGDYTLKDVIEMVKTHTGVQDLRIAVSNTSTLDSKINNFACCCGSGSSVLKEIKSSIDLFITGEMSHHELLDAAAKNISVIILNHSNSERGFLKHFAVNFQNQLGDDVQVIVSKRDTDPLQTA
jgi:dinuclear metal center YbgI/SA1388 family protein